MTRYTMLLAGMLAALAVAAGEPKKAVAVGEKAAEIQATDLAGKKLSLADLQKIGGADAPRALVLCFWCTTCHSCRDMEARLDKLARDYSGKAAVVALAVNADETAKSVTDSIKRRKLSLPVVLETSGKAAEAYGVKVTTTTLVIDAAGVLRYRGQFDHGQHLLAEDALKAVLAGGEIKQKETQHRG